jgi:crotonobetainyl-CoA:carnitine CoA-transferase CaiB-like acyl-CoA transferase
MKVGIAITDLMTGMYATTAILGALEHRHVSGTGQYIDMSLLDCVVTVNSYVAINYFLSGKLPRRMGNAHANMVPYQVFRCREGSLIVAVGNDSQFRSLCRVVGRDDLAADERYASAGNRNRHRETLIPELAQALALRPMAEWVALLEAANVPCGPINDMQQVFDDPQVRHRGMKLSLPHAAGVQAPGVASPLRFSQTPVAYGRAAPTLGEHTDAVLAEKLGLDTARIAALRAKGVV